jgi:hypothetical protein
LGDSELTVARYAAQISLWALWVSAGALFVAACAFGLEVRRWFDEGVRLSLSVMPNAIIIGPHGRDRDKYLSVTVTNRGDAPTTITHMVLYNYPSRLARWVPQWLYRRTKRFNAETWVINAIGAPGPIPYVLEPGRTWSGRASQTPDVERMIDGGRLYVGIISSHRKRTFFKRVKAAWKPPANAKTA